MTGLVSPAWAQPFLVSNVRSQGHDAESPWLKPYAWRRALAIDLKIPDHSATHVEEHMKPHSMNIPLRLNQSRANNRLHYVGWFKLSGRIRIDVDDRYMGNLLDQR